MERIEIIISEDVNQKAEALARRRYGNREDGLGEVFSDALEWKLDCWDKYGQPTMDFIWLRLANVAPIPWLRKVAWGKLIEPYFDVVVG